MQTNKRTKIQTKTQTKTQTVTAITAGTTQMMSGMMCGSRGPCTMAQVSPLQGPSHSSSDIHHSDASPMPPLVWSLCFGSNLCHGYRTDCHICSYWGFNIFRNCHADHYLHEHASSSPRLLQAQHTSGYN